MAKSQAPQAGSSWQDTAPGGIVNQPGSAAEYVTGTWRSMRPMRDLAQCTQCLICWIVCPDAAITVAEGKVVGFDYDHCKGCGICAQECPVKIKQPHAHTGQMGQVIQMMPESDFDE